MPTRQLTFDTRRIDASGRVYYECLCSATFYTPQGFAGHTTGCRVWWSFRQAQNEHAGNALRSLLRRRYESGLLEGRHQCTRPHNSWQWRDQYLRTHPRPRPAAVGQEVRHTERRNGWLAGYQAGYSDGFSNSEEQTEAPDNV